MMICPQNKAECAFGCDSVESCQRQLAPYEFCDAVTIGSSGEVVTDPCVTSFTVQPTPSGWALESVAIQEKPKPSLAEFERLLDAFEVAVVDHIRIMHGTLPASALKVSVKDRHAALIDYVKRMGVE